MIVRLVGTAGLTPKLMVNPTRQFTKRPLEMPDPIPDSEAERSEMLREMYLELKELGRDTIKAMTTFEWEVFNDLNSGLACTRTRFKIARDAYQRIKKELG